LQSERLYENLYLQHFKYKPSNAKNWKLIFINRYRSKSNFAKGEATVSRLKYHSSKILFVDLNEEYIFSYGTDLNLNVISILNGKLITSFKTKKQLIHMFVFGNNKIIAIDNLSVHFLEYQEEEEKIVESNTKKNGGYYFFNNNYLISVDNATKVKLLNITTMESTKIQFNTINEGVNNAWIHNNILFIIYIYNYDTLLFRYSLIEKRNLAKIEGFSFQKGIGIKNKVQLSN
jgi:hypothetical protein